MKAKAKRMSLGAIAILAVFAMGLVFGKTRPTVSAQTEVLVQGRYVIIDKTKDRGGSHYVMFDTQNGVLREWSGIENGTVTTFEFNDPREVVVSQTAIRRR